MGAPAEVAVFTRNHREYLETATGTAGPITFRAAACWARAGKELKARPSLDLYISPIGSDGLVEYVAELCGVYLYPKRGDPRVKELMKHELAATMGEGLWDERVNTLYVIQNCRELGRGERFPMTRLVKASDRTSISKNYNYSYSVVYRR